MSKLFKSAILGAALAATAIAPAFATINATDASRQMLREMEISLVGANNALAQVPASDLSQVTDIIADLGQDAHIVHAAFYGTPVDTSGVCSRSEIVDATDDLQRVIVTYRDHLGSPPADLLQAFNRLSDRLERIEDRLGDALNDADAGC